MKDKIPTLDEFLKIAKKLHEESDFGHLTEILPLPNGLYHFKSDKINLIAGQKFYDDFHSAMRQKLLKP